MEVRGLEIGNTYPERMAAKSRANMGSFNFADYISSKTQKETASRDTFISSVREEFLRCEVYGKQNIKSNLVGTIQSVETEKYTIEGQDDGYVRIYDKERKEAFKWKLNENQIQVDETSGKKFLINDLGVGFFNMVAVDEELEQGLKEAFGTDELPEKELTGFTVHQDKKTGIHYITANGYESRGGLLVLDEEGSKKLDALANEYLSQYPGLFKDYNEAWFYATFEVRGLAKRTSSGIMMISPNSITFKGKDGESRWTAIFEEDMWEVVKESFDNSGANSKFEEWGYWQRFFTDKKIEHFLVKPDSLV